ncbi:hypothetical protein CXG81DRAFT_10118 [Caulochytrium protostelioides]|uniref:Protein kinase domain-containing protein n=1 Tax=Caulochytrium protostelioides TaxID=1555241 RepID=A0A4P9XC37_9FUNG|nr:hypothetical protein CXG81DRAFT_10118 [Caulochytrium protostelioides]|eukprot:RKP02997.1 hypothetical protein CXG81DRAFT_10118 [Caulochytrium protostelioides]
MFAPTLALEDAGEGDGRVAAAGAGPPQADLRENWDDAEGYYVTVVGEVLDGRYRVTAPLGKGVFSTVVRARREPSADPADDAAIAAPVDVAIKIVRRNDLMQAAAEHEIKVLETLGRADPRGERHVARLLASFWHKQHRCLVFEAMHTDLRAVLRDHGAGRGLRLETVAVMARHLFLALGLLRDCGYVHLDIKPDNVLLAADRQSVVLADLGSATDVPQQAATPYLASRFYRAPEVILGHDPSAAVDTWAAGCTLAELATGQILFAGRDNNDMLFRIMQTLGKVPHRLIRRGPTAAVSAHFDGGPALLFRQHTRDRLTGRPVARLLAIAAGPASAADALAARFPHCPSSLNAARTPFERRLWHLVDLVERCLALNPDRRITPAAALAHPFIAGPWAPSASAEASS